MPWYPPFWCYILRILRIEFDLLLGFHKSRSQNCRTQLCNYRSTRDSVSFFINVRVRRQLCLMNVQFAEEKNAFFMVFAIIHGFRASYSAYFGTIKWYVIQVPSPDDYVVYVARGWTTRHYVFGINSNFPRQRIQDCNHDGVIDCLDYASIHKLGGYGCSAPLDQFYKNKYDTCQRAVLELSGSAGAQNTIDTRFGQQPQQSQPFATEQPQQQQLFQQQ